MILWRYIGITILLLAFEWSYFKLAKKFDIVDKPNNRSSHFGVVLRGGGVIYIFAMWLYAAFFGLDQWPFLLGLSLIAGVSFLDDIHPLPDSLRLVVQFVSMGLMFYDWGILQLQSWWIIILALVLCVGIINAYNFMDGINGINGAYSMAVLLPLLWLNTRLAFISDSFILVVILSDLLFLYFNFRPKGRAKCFAGDVGSVGVAFILIYLLGLAILKTGDFTYIVFLAVYGVDSILTICHRIMLRENLGQAHRKHAYQIMANELRMGHLQVSTLYFVLQFAIAAIFFLLPDNALAHWLYLTGAVLLLSVCYVLFMRKYYHLHEEYLASLKK